MTQQTSHAAADLQLSRLRVTQLRKFDALELPLRSGLNIITGPNGAGKSSLARAIRAAFLDRYSSNSAADLQPHGNSGAAPTVELDFVLRGVPHQLVKTFLKKKRCDLRVGSSSKTEQDAEDYLAEALGFGFGKRGSGEEHWGVPGLLWVEQGFAPHQLDTRIGYASAQLGEALHAHAGDGAAATAGLAASTGDALIAQLEKSLETLLTRGTRKPTGAYADVLKTLDDKTAQLAEQQRRVAEYQQQVDELAQLLAATHQDAVASPATQWQTELDQARAQWAQVQAVQQRQQQAQRDVARLDDTLAALARELQAHTQQQRKLQERDQAALQARDAHGAAEQALAAARLARDRAAQQAAEAANHWQAAQQGKARADMVQRVAQAEREQQRLQTGYAEAQQQLQKLQLLTHDLSALALQKADIQQLVALQNAAHQAAMQRDALATQLQFQLSPAQALHWQGGTDSGTWQGEGTQWLDRATTVQLPGGGSLCITPGGHTVDGVAAKYAQAQADLAQALQRCGVGSVAQAQAQWERRQQLEAERTVAQKLLAAQAPQGLDALQLELAQAQSQWQGLQQQLAAMPAAASAMDWENAQAAQRATEAALHSAQAQEHAASQQLALAAQQWQGAQAEQAAAAQALHDPAVQARQQAAQQQITLRDAEREQLHQQLAADAQALAEPAARFADQDMARLERSLQAHAQQVQQRNVRTVQLRAALEVAGAQGLEEVNAALAADIGHAQRRADEMQGRAAALVMVVDRLKAKRTAALRRLQAPLEAHMQHYVQLLLPGGRVELDDALVPRMVLAPDSALAAPSRVAGDVASLSYGTQEQLGILGRLAYADLLRDAGKPTLLMMDDALVYSDAERLVQMKRALFDAAQRHQIVLFTCHPALWQDMGVAPHALPGA